MKPGEPAGSSNRQPQSPKIRRRLHPGDRLVREWNGRNHVVVVIKRGFTFDGKNWNSLSAIARRITGAPLVGSALLRVITMQQMFRCAGYPRKSTEEGLDQEFNSLDAQREACEAYIASQAGLGWRLVSGPYDEGGISRS